MSLAQQNILNIHLASFAQTSFCLKQSSIINEQNSLRPGNNNIYEVVSQFSSNWHSDIDSANWF
jgi:hypothetical protein